MKRSISVFWAFILLVAAPGAMAGQTCTATYGQGNQVVRLATGSPGELGLLKVVAQTFNAKHDSQICWIKAGSGKSLKLLHDKQVDAVMVHAPKAEKQAVDEGWAIARTLLGSNEFYLVGPASDPAGIRDATSVVDAYKRIANAKAKFLSRGDNSGTHKKEMMIWKKSEIEPSGDWYIVTHDFMMATLQKANEIGGYFMTDSSTWVAGKKNLGVLEVLYRGDPFLINVYHALCAPEGTTPAAVLAKALIEFLASGEGQKIIGNYGREDYGEAMYNDAAYAAQYAH